MGYLEKKLSLDVHEPLNHQTRVQTDDSEVHKAGFAYFFLLNLADKKLSAKMKPPNSHIVWGYQAETS